MKMLETGLVINRIAYILPDKEFKKIEEELSILTAEFKRLYEIEGKLDDDCK